MAEISKDAAIAAARRSGQTKPACLTVISCRTLRRAAAIAASSLFDTNYNNRLQQRTFLIGVTFELHVQRLHSQTEQLRRLGLAAAALL